MRFAWFRKGVAVLIIIELLVGTSAFGLVCRAQNLNDNVEAKAKDGGFTLDYQGGDKVFFHSDYISDIGDTYKSCIVAQKSNKIIFHRCEERYNPNRTDNSIEMIKTTAEDCHLDILSDKRYPNLLIRSKVMVPDIGPKVHFAYVRQTFDGNVREDTNLLQLNSDGSLVTPDGSILRTITAGEWFSYAAAINLQAHTADIYLGDENLDLKLIKTIDISKKYTNIQLVRMWINTGMNGTVKFDELEVVGSVQPYTGTDDNYSSVFHSDEPLEAYLADKIAFHAYSGGIFSGGTKNFSDTTLVYDDEQAELYADSRALQVAFGISVSEIGNILTGEGICFTENSRKVLYKGTEYSIRHSPRVVGNKLLIPIKTFAETVLGKLVFDDTAGLIILSDYSLDLDLENEIPEYKNNTQSASYPYTDIKSLNWYMAFRRPIASEIQEKMKTSLSSHPRILANKEDFDRIRSDYKKSGSTKAKFCQNLIEKANRAVTAEPPEYNIPDKQRILTISKTISERMEHLGFAYQMTGDKKYIESAWKNLLKAASYPDWNPSHMIDIGEMNYAFALAYDWMYDGFTQEQRNTIYQAARRLGLEDTHNAYYGRLVSWQQWAQSSDAFVKWKSNFNTVINGGALAGAMAFAENDIAFCADLAANAIRSLEFTLIAFAPDGAWAEALGYWDYTMNFLSKGVGSVITSLGTDFGLLRTQGLSDTAKFFAGMSSAEGINNYHDASRGAMRSPWLSWLGEVYSCKDYGAIRYQQISGNPNYGTVYDMVWNTLGYSKDKPNLPEMIVSRGLESIGIHEDYGDDEGLYFSAHGGMVSSYHSHADVGNFIYDVLGERWTDDLGMEDYNVQRDGGGGYYQPYRRRAEAHNVVVINPNESDKDGGQMTDAFVPLTEHRQTGYGSLIAYDMTDAYRNYANKYERKFLVDKDTSSVSVGDYILLKDSAEVDWFMTTGAQIEINGTNKFTLTKNGKTIYGKVDVTGGTFILEKTACAPILGKPVLEGQNKNEGFSRLRIKLQGTGDVVICVILSPQKDYAVFEGNCRIADISVVGRTSGKAVVCVKGAWGEDRKGFILVVAENDDSDRLLNCKVFHVSPPERSETPNIAPVNLEYRCEYTPVSENSEIQAFAFESFSSMKPLF